MPEDVMTQFIAHLFATYGPIAFPVVGLLLVVKYLLDKDAKKDVLHREEIASQRKLVEGLQAELLREARGNATLAEDVRKILEVMAREKT